MSLAKYQLHVFDFLLPSIISTLGLFIVPAIYSWLTQPTENDVWWFLLYPFVMKPLIMLITAVGGAALVFAPLMLLLSSAGMDAKRTVWVAMVGAVLLCFVAFGLKSAIAFACYTFTTLTVRYGMDSLARRTSSS
ncbi:MAG TPA: hypothetical protein VFV64_01565 [Permianibacter sp.]|nr:hypothetical protein [Permianibacter sp.]